MTPKAGELCSFYHEGSGHGERHWVTGWRVGRISNAPQTGRHKGWVCIELLVPRWSRDRTKKRVVWVRQPNEKVWVNAMNVNALGDTVYAGRSEQEVLEERREAKAAEQAKADKIKAKARRFHR